MHVTPRFEALVAANIIRGVFALIIPMIWNISTSVETAATTKLLRSVGTAVATDVHTFKGLGM